MADNRQPRRAVVNLTFFGRRGSSVYLKLSCGHEVHRKASQLPVTTVRCPFCPQLEVLTEDARG